MPVPSCGVLENMCKCSNNDADIFTAHTMLGVDKAAFGPRCHEIDPNK